jgi:hypothetical protein
MTAKHLAASRNRCMPRAIDERYKNRNNDPRGPYALVDLTAPIHRPAQVFSWEGHFPPQGRSWRFTAGGLEKLAGEGAIHFSETARPRLKRYLSDVRQEPAEELAPEFPSVEAIVRTCMQSLAMKIAHDPSALDTVEWRDLERVFREVFEKLGFDTQLTRPGKDGGFDLKLSCTQNGRAFIFLVEVKHWIKHSKKPGLPVVRALFDIVASTPEVTAGVLLSSSGYTASAVHGRTEVEYQQIRLGDRTKIASLFQNYIRSKENVWMPALGLPELLLEGTQ